MNGDTKKKIVSEEEVKLKFGMAGMYGKSFSEKIPYIGKHEKRKPTPASIELDEKIRDFKRDLRALGDDVLYECFMNIVELMFYCMYHHMYSVLFNALKDAHKKF